MIVFAILVSLITGCITAIFYLFRGYRKQRSLERVHKRLVRRAYGCVLCGRELHPGQWRWVCGTCSDGYDTCSRCYKPRNGIEQASLTHPHIMFKEPIFWEKDASTALSSCNTTADTLKTGMELFSERWFLGWRERYLDGHYARDFTWHTYGEILSKVQSVACSLLTSAKLCSMQDTVLLCGAVSVEWFVIQYACFLAGVIFVPLHPSSSIAAITETVLRAKPKLIFASRHLQLQIRSACQVAIERSSPPLSALEYLVFFEDNHDNYALRTDDSNIGTPTSTLKELYWNSMLLTNFRACKLPAISAQPETVIMLIPSSGTTGLPKLITVTDSMFKHQTQTQQMTADTLVLLAFEPLRQSLDVVCKGGRIGIWSGSMERLLEDCQILRPTVFGSTPNLWNGLYMQFLVQQFLLFFVTHLPKADIKHHDCSLSQDAFYEVQKEWEAKRLFGNRLRLVITGGSAIRQELKKWIVDILGCLVLDGYGTTETGGLTGNSLIHPGTCIQLVDVPELGYLTSDKPNPRGEIVVSTSRITPGYWNDAETTKKQFITLGGKRFFKTGDIGELVRGKLHVIDRCSAIFKLLQGVFVAPEPLELLFARSPFVSQIFVYGESSMPFVAAVVVPTSIALARVLPDNCAVVQENLASQCKNLESLYLEEFRIIAKGNDLKSWETPQIIIIEHEQFSQWNGLLSTAGKPCRPTLQRKYKSVILSRFQVTSTTIPEPFYHNSTNLQPKDNSTELCSGLLEVIHEVLPHCALQCVTSTSSLFDLGADSMALARVVASIKARFGVDIPLPVIAKFPTLLHLQTAVFSGYNAVLEDLHPPNWEREVSYYFNQLANFQLACVEQQHNATPAVLLTGCTGFVGSFLLHKLLTHSCFCDYEILCPVRALSENEANERVIQSLKFYCLWENSMANKIRAFPGDLKKPLLGIPSHILSTYLPRIRAIFHNGAEVNSALPYSVIKDTNVVGTQQALMIALKCAHPAIPFYHISTMGLTHGSGVTIETANVPATYIDKLSGYAQSKWVAEQLVTQAATHFGLRACIFRLGTISGDSCSGACNMRDSVTRLIAGLSLTQVYCNTDDTPLPLKFLLAPVDWVSESIISISVMENANGVFHLTGSCITPLQTVIDALLAFGITMKECLSSAFKDLVSNVKDDHPLFVFRGILCGTGFQSKELTLPDCSRTSAILGTKCPVVTVSQLCKTLEFITSNWPLKMPRQAL